MATVSLSAIRSRFATKIATLAGFTQSRNPYDPALRAPQSVAHLRFWVGITEGSARPDDTQRAGQGIFMDTTVAVKFAYRLRPKDQVIDLDAAMDKAEILIQALTTRAAPLYTNLHIRFRGITPEITTPGEFAIMHLEFSALHFITL